MKTLLLSVGFLFLASVLPAGERVALVIGNQDYTKTGRFPDLSTTAADANEMHRLLKAAGFRVGEPVLNVTRIEMEEKLIAFGESLKSGDEAVVYFAGHGVEYENKVWLMGTNAEFLIKAKLGEEAVSQETVAALLGERGVKIAVILLDCCREKPDQTWLASEIRQRGLRGARSANLNPPPNILIGFATSSERLTNDALKRSDANGPLVDALRRHWEEGLEFDALWKAVAREVFEQSRKAAEAEDGAVVQMPSKYGQTIHDFFFTKTAAGPTPTMAVTPPAPVPLPAPVPVPTPPDDYSVFAGKTAGERKLVEVAPGVPVPFRWCPPGSFTMGSPQSEKDLLKAAGVEESVSADEIPHRVTLTRGFWLAETEVTQGQWQAVMGTTLPQQAGMALRDDTLYDLGGKQQTYRDFAGWKKDTDPATLIGSESEKVAIYWVSHGESEDWCGRASRHAGQRGWAVALPSEAQWEYACRAGSTGMSYAGDFQIKGQCNAPGLDGIAWYGGNSSQGFSGKGWSTDSFPEKQYPGGTAGPRRVGGKEPNAWGLLDIIGNVWEWTADSYGDYATGSVTDPTGASSGVNRVSRGGSWNDYAARCRAANRNWDEPGFRYSNLGFRPALVPSR